MRTNKAGIELIKRFEGCRLEAYKCPAGVWTIGYGHTEDVKPGMKITQHQAEVMLEHDLIEYENGVKYLLGDHPVTENQFAALVSFAYNCGTDIDLDDKPEGLGDSTLLKKFLRGDIEGAGMEFLKWTRAGGKVLPGLVKRRKAERALFLTK